MFALLLFLFFLLYGLKYLFAFSYCIVCILPFNYSTLLLLFNIFLVVYSNFFYIFGFIVSFSFYFLCPPFENSPLLLFHSLYFRFFFVMISKRTSKSDLFKQLPSIFLCFFWGPFSFLFEQSFHKDVITKYFQPMNIVSPVVHLELPKNVTATCNVFN